MYFCKNENCVIAKAAKEIIIWICVYCVADYGETKIKWRTKALSESAEFLFGGTHNHYSGCVVGNFETKHKCPDSGQLVVFCMYTPGLEKT